MGCSSLVHSAKICQNMSQQTIPDDYFHRVFEQSPIAQMMYNADGSIIRVNPALNTLLGYAPGALLFHTIQDVVLPLNSERPDVIEVGLGTLSSKFLQLDRLCQRGDGGTLEAKITLYSLNSADGDFLHNVALIESISTQKARESQIQLFAHDVKSPLTNILSAVALLQEELPKATKSTQELLSYIQTSARHAIDIADTLHRLSSVAQGATLNKQEESLNKLLQNALNDCAMLAREKAITLDFSGLTPDVALSFDMMLMRQALDNLLTNAIKYTASGGRVAVSMLLTADEVIITVDDNGLGIPQADIDKVFRRFYRVESAEHLAVDGTGLGLSIIKAIVEQHGGRIWLESELGVGSTFYITLPLDANT